MEVPEEAVVGISLVKDKEAPMEGVSNTAPRTWKDCLLEY